MENVSIFVGAIRSEEDFASLILDFSDVPYIDSSALGALVSTYVSRQKVGKRITLAGISDQVSKLMEITNVKPLFVTFSTLEDAIGLLAHAGNA